MFVGVFVKVKCVGDFFLDEVVSFRGFFLFFRVVFKMGFYRLYRGFSFDRRLFRDRFGFGYIYVSVC